MSRETAIRSLEALEKIKAEISDMYQNYTDENGYRLIRKSDVLNIIDKHLLEVEGSNIDN